MRISLIAACDRDGVIGDGKSLPWRIPADLQRFRELTFGKPVVMGRRTVESLPWKLAGRKVIAMSRQPGWRDERADYVACDRQSAVRIANRILADSAKNSPGNPPDELMIAGGGDVYRLFLPLADRVYLTLIETPTTVVFPVRFPLREFTAMWLHGSGWAEPVKVSGRHEDTRWTFRILEKR